MDIACHQRRRVGLCIAAVAGVALATGGCAKGSGPPLTSLGTAPAAAPAPVPAPGQSGPDRIRATPNPVVGGPTIGSTTVSWVAPGASSVAIFVSVDGAVAKLFAKGGSTGTAVAGFITANHVFAFEMFPDSSRRAVSTVLVKRR